VIFGKSDASPQINHKKLLPIEPIARSTGSGPAGARGWKHPIQRLDNGTFGFGYFTCF